MASLKQKWRNWYDRWQADWVADWPSPNARLRAWFDMMVFDHGFLRVLWRNFAEVSEGVYRANQPGPARVKAWGEMGIKSIINLRGESDWGSYHLEKEAAEDAGIELIDQRLYSRRSPYRAEALGFLDALEKAPRPVVIHCKSGADRAGVAAAMALLAEGADAERASEELSLRYLHVKAAKTGVLDAFIAHFGAYQKTGDLGFRDWLEQVYDPEVVEAGFSADGAGNFFVDKVLRRE